MHDGRRTAPPSLRLIRRLIFLVRGVTASSRASCGSPARAAPRAVSEQRLPDAAQAADSSSVQRPRRRERVRCDRVESPRRSRFRADPGRDSILGIAATARSRRPATRARLDPQQVLRSRESGHALRFRALIAQRLERVELPLVARLSPFGHRSTPGAPASGSRRAPMRFSSSTASLPRDADHVALPTLPVVGMLGGEPDQPPAAMASRRRRGKWPRSGFAHLGKGVQAGDDPVGDGSFRVQAMDCRARRDVDRRERLGERP